MFRGPYLLAAFLGVVVICGIVGVIRPMRATSPSPRNDVLLSDRMVETLRR